MSFDNMAIPYLEPNMDEECKEIEWHVRWYREPWWIKHAPIKHAPMELTIDDMLEEPEPCSLCKGTYACKPDCPNSWWF